MGVLGECSSAGLLAACLIAASAPLKGIEYSMQVIENVVGHLAVHV